MYSFIIYPTALEFWLHHGTRKLAETSIRIFSKKQCGFNRECLLDTALEYGLTFPIYVAVPYHAGRTHGPDFVCSVLPENLPKGSFVKIAENVYVSSPEMCFLQAARILDLPQLVCMGNELCGDYRHDKTSSLQQAKRDAVTNAKKINNYLDKAGQNWGIARARKAAKYVLDHAFSPFEAAIAAVAVLPIVYGGFALPKPILNGEIKFSPAAARYAGRDSCRGDMFWPDKRVVFEYDSTLVHLGIGQHYYDKKKATALIDSGYKLVSATAEQFGSFQSFEKLFFMLRNDLGLKNRSDRFEKFGEQRWKAFNELFRGKY